MTDQVNTDLENFRKQWKEEVTRSRGAPTSLDSKPTRPPGPAKASSHSSQTYPTTALPAPSEILKGDEEEYINDLDAQDCRDVETNRNTRPSGEDVEATHPDNIGSREPRSALEHYEKAAERETDGNLGDSLNLYRKAYKLDARVDQIYKNKHFPPSSFKSMSTNLNPSNAAVTVPNPAHHSLEGPPASSTAQLIASFSSLSILPVSSLQDELPPPPCPISKIPSELLVEILQYTAIVDIASFARLSLACKHLAYLVATEDQIWKRVCLGPEIGFSTMHYTWTHYVSDTPFRSFSVIDSLDDFLSRLNLKPLNIPQPSSFPLSLAYPTYKHMFQTRPRLRFNGCYISTVNYIRPGASSPSQISWNTPVHIVTYYRYLRFFRDGSCISLLTTTEPADVVHNLSTEHMSSHNPVMKHALRGRWRLSGGDHLDGALDQSQNIDERLEGDVHIETEGVGEKYTYRMHLVLKSAGRTRATRNNKLVWKGFRSYNKLTDDWAEFGLRNDRAFFWSRVKSFGMGW